MNLALDMKKLHAKKFRDGKIRQATFLKSYKKEILDLLSLDYKPSEIKDFLEEKLDVSINMNSFYAWLRYTRQEASVVTGEKKSQVHTLPDLPSSIRPESGSGSALDILNDTQFD